MKRRKWWLAIGIAIMLCASMGMFACSKSSDGHNLSLHEAQSATCTEEGHDAYYSCSHCDKLFADDAANTEVKREDVFHAALGHSIADESYVVGEPNSCTEAGVLAHYTCERCGNAFADKAGTVLIEDTVLPAGHSVGEFVSYIAPSIATEGRAEHYVCADCGKYFSDAACKHEITQDATVLARVPEYAVSLTVKTYDAQGVESSIDVTSAQISSSAAADAKYSLTITSTGAVTNDKDNGGKYAAGTYRIIADGYYSSEFTVAATDTQKEISLYALDRTLYNPNDKCYVTGMLDSEGNKSFAFDKPYNAGAWNTLGMLELADDGNDSAQSYIYEFAVGISDLLANDWSNRLMFAFTDCDAAKNMQSAGADVVGIGLAFKNGNLALYNLQKNWEDRNNTLKEFGADGASASDRAFTSMFYSAAMRGTLRMRVVRLENAVSLYVNVNGTWSLLRTATLSSASNSGLIVTALGNGNVTVSQIEAGEFVDYAENSAGTSATLAHFEIGEKVYNMLGADTTLDEITRPIIELKSFKADPENRFNEDIIGILGNSNVTYNVTVKAADNAIANDNNSVKYVSGTYTFTAEGCFPREVVIDENSAGEDVVMPLYFKKYKLFGNEEVGRTVEEKLNDDKHNIVFNGNWSDKKDIGEFGFWEIEDNNGSGNYRVEFTIRVASSAGMLKYQNRVYFFGSSYNKAYGYKSLTGGDVLGICIRFDGGAYTAVQKGDGAQLKPGTFALTDAVEAKLCIVRNGNKLSLYQASGSGWSLVGETTLAQYDNGLTIGVDDNQEVVISDIKQYIFHKGSTDSTTGVITPDHYTDSEGKYYDINGKPADSLDTLKITPVTPESFIVSGLDSAADAKFAGGGMVLDISIDASGNVTRKDNSTWYPKGPATITLFGYEPLDVAMTSSAVTGAFTKIAGVGFVINGSDKGKGNIGSSAGTYTLKMAWDDPGNTPIADMGYLQIIDSSYTGNYSIEFTISGGNGNGMSRMYFAAADYTQALNFNIANSDNTVGISMRFGGGNQKWYGDLHERYRDDQTLQKDTTTRFKVERNGNSMKMYFLQDESWELLHSVTLNETLTNNGFGIFGTAGSAAIGFSDFVFTPIAA